jgi:hypothetical protein
MARSDTRYSVYPAPKAVQIVGNSAPALNQAIECWAALLARATAENSREFHQAWQLYDPERNPHAIGLDQWSLLAEALKGMRIDPEFANPGLLLATAVEDAHRLEDLGFKCYNWGGCDSSVINPDIDAEVGKVVEKLRLIDYPHAWAVIVAVQWYWEHHKEIQKTDDWWTLKYRRQWKGSQPSKQSPTEAGGQKPGARARKSKRREASNGGAETSGA